MTTIIVKVTITTATIIIIITIITMTTKKTEIRTFTEITMEVMTKGITSQDQTCKMERDKVDLIDIKQIAKIKLTSKTGNGYRIRFSQKGR